MILSCPECETQFKISRAKLGEHGRKVRCGSCHHVWHQEPIDPDAAGLSEYDDDVTAAIERFHGRDPYNDKDTKSGSYKDQEDHDLTFAQELESLQNEEKRQRKNSVPADKPKKKMFFKGSSGGTEHKNIALSVCLGVILFMILVGVSVVFKPRLEALWPKFSGLYTVMGFSNYIEGEGLVFDRVNVAIEDATALISAEIINLGQIETSIPDIYVVFYNAAGDVVSEHIFNVEQDMLASESAIPMKKSLDLNSSENNMAEGEITRAKVSFRPTAS